MLDAILDSQNIENALEFLLEKKDTSGIDGMPLSQLPEYLSLNRDELFSAIRNGTYSPQTVIQFEALGKNGKRRTLSKFSSIDRLILRAVYQCLYEFLAPTFSSRSFVFRKDFGTIDAVRLAAQYASQGHGWMAEVDVRHYFDEIPHSLLMELLRSRIQDEKLCLLLEKYLTCYVSMFVIVAYDVSKKRVSKTLKICRKYLHHVQNSVFEGRLTPAQLQKMKSELEKVIVPAEDGILIYRMETTRFIQKDTIGAHIKCDSIIG
ncbi:MAG: CRISPR-associated endonuclease Cas2 [Treponema sp.]|nr:CRISPR-associated endonuclease Cas2 [Treponema sp.]